MVTRKELVDISTHYGLDRSCFVGRYQWKRYIETALRGCLATCHMSLHQPSNQIVRRRALAPCQSFECPEDTFRKFHCRSHTRIVPCHGGPRKHLSADQSGTFAIQMLPLNSPRLRKISPCPTNISMPLNGTNAGDRLAV